MKESYRISIYQRQQADGRRKSPERVRTSSREGQQGRAGKEGKTLRCNRLTKFCRAHLGGKRAHTIVHRTAEVHCTWERGQQRVKEGGKCYHPGKSEVPGNASGGFPDLRCELRTSRSEAGQVTARDWSKTGSWRQKSSRQEAVRRRRH